MTRILGVGGSTRPGSMTEQVVAAVLAEARSRGAETSMISGPDLLLPHYDPGTPAPVAADRLIAEARQADALVVGSPGYHGTISGLVKNALDYLEECRADPRPYLDDVPVGCIATAAGWQASVMTLQSLRQVVHALRGWPTPLGIAINTSDSPVIVDGAVTDERVAQAISVMVDHLMGFRD